MDGRLFPRRASPSTRCCQRRRRPAARPLGRPPRQPDVCDLDGAPLIQRDDDRPEVIRQRLIVSERDTAPVADYSREKGLLTTINANEKPEQVTAAMIAAISGPPEETAHSSRGESPQAGPPAPQR